MDRVIRRFAQRVVAIHVLLLLVLMVVVAHASREIYRSARAQALDQAKSHQALLVGQTARGVEGFYNAILDSLDLMRLADEGTAAEGRDAGPADGPRRNSKPLASILGGRAVVFAHVVERQLKGRVSQVFLIDRRKPDEAPRVIGEPDKAIQPVEVMAAFGDWLRKVDGPGISPFAVHPEAGGYNVVATPMRLDHNLVLAATVPVRPMQTQLLGPLSRGTHVAMLLADDAGVVMTASEQSWVGYELAKLGVAGEELRQLRAVGFRDVRVNPQPFKIGDVINPPSMFATEPVEVAGRKWMMLIASPLAEVDAAVTSLVHNGIPWVVFVVCAITALLASTSIQLIRNRMRMERERTRALENDIGNARQIQLAWLPNDGKTVAHSIDVAAVNMPAAHVSGDFYNWFALPDGRVAVVIGDVTGHGMSAAFLMATVQLLVRNTLPQLGDPGRCLQQVNDQLCVQMFLGQFVTIQVLVIDPANGKLEIANAGHPPPLVCDGGGASFTPLKVEPQLVLGIQAGVDYPTETFDLTSSGGILLYTDGVVDAVASDGSRFDTERLRDNLSTTHCATAAERVQSVVEMLARFRGGRELVDDLTLVSVQCQPAGAGAARREPAAVA